MLDGNNTTIEWQEHTGEICVLPVGAFEQHSRHLPLDTDSIEAEYFSRFVADRLDAVLLPTLHFGTSLEMTGFRGTITLRPETLMRIIRDVADEMERQNFKVLIVVNGHGGNHCLAPVCRDINRMDRGLKVLLANMYEFCDPALAAESKALGLDMHSGEWETSLMLALRSDLVRDERADMPAPTDDRSPLQQRDLTTFGVGHMNPQGAAGFPSTASEQKGKQIVASVEKNMLEYLRDRLARLKEQRRYVGGGGIIIRRLANGDIGDAMRLKEQAGWNQTEEDWRLFLSVNPTGCLAAVHNGKTIGTVTTVNYGKEVSWIGMLLVDREFRRQGIARQLLGRALENLQGCDTVKLDATAVGRELYQEMGFKDEYFILRMTTAALNVPTASPAVVSPVTDKTITEVTEFDREVFGGDRGTLLKAWWQRNPQSAWQVIKNGRIAGYCLGRKGSQYFQIGPLVAPSTAEAIALLEAVARIRQSEPVVIDVPEAMSEFVDWLGKNGFSTQRSFMRMYRGSDRSAGIPSQVFASSGPELG